MMAVHLLDLLRQLRQLRQLPKMAQVRTWHMAVRQLRQLA